MYKNIQFIQRKLIKCVLFVSVFAVIVCFLIGRWDWVLSYTVGTMFSYLIFYQLLSSQYQVLKQRSKGKAILFYFFRLGLYAIPIIATFLLKNYLTIFVILVSLMQFQIFYVIFEFKKNLKRYKRRQKKWTKSEK